MADYAVMPYTDYEDACNAVREKTGGTANIKSGEMGAQIRAIDTQEDLSEELTAQDTAIAEQDTKISELLAALEGKAAVGNATPSVFVSSSGLVTAVAGDKTATTQLSDLYDPNFVASNIVSGKTIFGLAGSASVLKTCNLKITNYSSYSISYRDGTSTSAKSIASDASKTLTIPQNSVVFIEGNATLTSDDKTNVTDYSYDDVVWCLRVGAVTTAKITFYN